MEQVKTNNQNNELKIELRKQVEEQMSVLTTKIPTYSELSKEEKEIVDEYVSTIDLHNTETIDKFGESEVEKIYEDLDVLIGTLKTNDISIENMFTELMMSINENSEPEGENFIELLKKSPLTALRSLKNRPKRMIDIERYRRAKVLSNISVVRERLESIRNELRTNAGKLEIMAQKSAEQYENMQYQIIALQEVARRLQEEREREVGLAEKTFSQIQRSIQLVGLEKRISRKIENCRGININAATKAIMTRLLAQRNEDLASVFDQDVSSLLPELKGIVLIAEANDSLIQAAEIRNQFVGKVNEMLRTESERSKEAIEKVQNISNGSAIEVKTAKVLTSDVLEIVASLKKVPDDGRVVNESFREILSDFRNGLIRELDGNRIEEER